MTARITVYADLSPGDITEAFQQLDYDEMLSVILGVSDALCDQETLEEVVWHLNNDEDFRGFRALLEKAENKKEDVAIKEAETANIGGTG